MVVGSSVSRKAYDKVFLSGHICERDREALLRQGLVHQPRARVTIATDVMLILQFRDSNVFSYAMPKEL